MKKVEQMCSASRDNNAEIYRKQDYYSIPHTFRAEQSELELACAASLVIYDEEENGAFKSDSKKDEFLENLSADQGAEVEAEKPESDVKKRYDLG